MKKAKVIIGLLLVAILLATVSCGASAVSEEMEEEEYISEKSEREIVIVESSGSGRDYEPAPVVITEPSETIEYSMGLGTGDDESWGTDRMIVRTGQIWLVVNDVPVAIDQITVLTESSGGYVVSSRMWKSGESLAGTISIRVPADDYNNVMEMLRGLAVDVTQETTNSSDVTEEYVDLTAKLENLEATEAQLLTIMEKAETVEEILDVQSELSKTRGEIEQTKGRMQYLERTSATSLINVSLEESRLNIEFTADKRRGIKEGEKIQFTISQITGGFPPYSYEWDFGNGDISTDENPAHSYTTEGHYTVTLTVTDDEGNTNTSMREGYITVVPGWSAGKIASNAWNGLVIFGQALANLFIWIGAFFPLWIVIGGIVFGVLYWRRRRNKKRNANPENQ
ncbi:DUF4349 domain-containing protein [Chloroflexota bacterium]